MTKKKTIMDYKRALSNYKKSMKKMDGWQNVMTNIGTGYDKTMQAAPVQRLLKQRECEDIYQADGVGARILDKPIEEMFREGFEIKIIEGDENLAEYAQQELEKWDVDTLMAESCLWGDMYGGGGVIIGIKDDDPIEPLDLTKKIAGIEYLVSVDRYSLNVLSTDVITDPANPAFRKPEFYSLQNNPTNKKENIYKFHHTRFIRFDGVKLPFNIMKSNSYWGDTLFSRLRKPLANFHTGYDGAAALLSDFAQAVIEIEGLDDLIAQGREELVVKRLELIARVNSVVNAIVLKSGEKYSRTSTSVAGLSDLLDKMSERLLMETPLTHTLLFGEGANGLGNTGESERKQWANHIKNRQEKQLRAKYRQILDIIFMTKGKMPKYTLEFNSIEQMTDKELAEIHNIQSQADERYIGNGTLAQSEIADSRFTPDGYSLETILDEKNRALLREQDPVEPDEEE